RIPTTLTCLDLSQSQQIRNVDFSKFTNLIELNLERCYYLQNLNGMSNLTNLRKLNLEYCVRLLFDPDFHHCFEKLTRLTELNCESCEKLQTVNWVSHLTNLTKLNLGNFLHYKKQPINISSNLMELSKLTNLIILEMIGTQSIQTVDGIAGLTNL